MTNTLTERDHERTLLRQQRRLLAAGQPDALAIAELGAELVEHALAGSEPTSQILGPVLAGELRGIRKGRGVHPRMRQDRIGPMLRLVCGIAPADRPALRAEKVGDWLRDRLALLPAELRLAALAGFGLDPDVPGHFYRERVEWVARQLGRDPRTARRRIDEAVDWLADIAAPGERAVAGHAVAELRGFVKRDVRVTYTRCGWTPHDRGCVDGTVLAVAQVVDDEDRYVLVVQAIDAPAPVAIPTSRIRQVELACDLYSPPADLHGWQPPTVAFKSPLARRQTLPGPQVNNNESR